MELKAHGVQPFLGHGNLRRRLVSEVAEAEALEDLVEERQASQDHAVLCVLGEHRCVGRLPLLRIFVLRDPLSRHQHRLGSACRLLLAVLLVDQMCLLPGLRHRSELHRYAGIGPLAEPCERKRDGNVMET